MERIGSGIAIEVFHLRDGLFTMRTRRKCGWRSEIGGEVVGLATLSKRVENPRKKFDDRVDDSETSGYD